MSGRLATGPSRAAGPSGPAPRDLDPVDLEGLDLEAFEGRAVAVLGLARSGLALTRFLVDRGARVTAYDARTRAELAEGLATLGDRRPRLLLGPEVDPRDALRGQHTPTHSVDAHSPWPTP